MSSTEFLLRTTLEGHTATITALEFSPDGRFLASAGDDGVLLIFSTASWSPVCRFLDVSPVSVLAWHTRKRYLLLCGFQSGDMHILTMSKSMVHLYPTHSRESLQYNNRNAPPSGLQNSQDVSIHYPSRRHRLVLPSLTGARSL